MNDPWPLLMQFYKIIFSTSNDTKIKRYHSSRAHVQVYWGKHFEWFFVWFESSNSLQFFMFKKLLFKRRGSLSLPNSMLNDHPFLEQALKKDSPQLKKIKIIRTVWLFVFSNANYSRNGGLFNIKLKCEGEPHFIKWKKNWTFLFLKNQKIAGNVNVLVQIKIEF